MSKKRKKQSLENKQKIVNAQHRNDFFKKLRNFCIAVTGEDIVMLIPQKYLNLIYYARTQAIIVKPGEGHDISPVLIEGIKLLVNLHLKQGQQLVAMTNKKVPLSDFYLLGLSLYIHLITLETIQYKNSDKVRALLWDTCGEIDFIFDLIYDNLHDNIFPYLIMITNNFCYHYYSYKIEIESNEVIPGVRFNIVVKKYPSERIFITIDNNTRPAYRIGWTFKADDFEWIYVTPEQLGLKTVFDKLKIPVYIQKHALLRLSERIDCIHPAYLIWSVYTSLRECIVIHEGNKFIIEFKVFDVKVGYLSAIMSDGKLVIRTFLFLTFNGTLEGKRLEDFVGLKKLDTKYLKMDKLSSFMSGKLASNEELRSIFEKADCVHLVELYDKLDQISAVHKESSPVELLTSYLRDNDVKLEDWEFNETDETTD